MFVCVKNRKINFQKVTVYFTSERSWERGPSSSWIRSVGMLVWQIQPMAQLGVNVAEKSFTFNEEDRPLLG
jgi:hypothetical protein